MSGFESWQRSLIRLMMPSCFSVLFPSRYRDPERAALLPEKPHDEFDEKAPPPMRAFDTTARLAQLRALMRAQGLDVYVVPTADEFGSEYVGDSDARRAWLSGFSGSAGTALVTATEALLFTDSRYFVQAAKQLDHNWTLMSVGLPGVPDGPTYLAQLPRGTCVAMDPKLVDYRTVKPLQTQLSASGVRLEFPQRNLINQIWTARPPRSAEPIHTHPLEFSGVSAEVKVDNLRKTLDDSGSYLLTSLPNIAWLLNLRGGDIAFTPIFYAYCIVAPFSLAVYVAPGQLTDAASRAIEDLGGSIHAIDDIWGDIKTSGKIVASGAISWALVSAIGEENLTVLSRSPVDSAEAIKNPFEIEGFKRAYLRDGAAWASWAAWLEETIGKGASISEWDAAEQLTACRRSGEYFAGLAYDNISATGENAALPHYAPTATVSSIINRQTPYLNDSGAQYLDGTIDNTRTVHFGKPSPEQRLAFTRVLQGHIAIDSAVFPAGTTGFQLDVLARQYLWRDGMNYGHGTGHGLGSYIGVHEGPHGIGPSRAFDIPLVPGNVTSNEPAYYEEGSFGIRIESVLFVKSVSTRRDFGGPTWLGFERLTVVPIQSSFVDKKLLTKVERRWLQEHNCECLHRLRPLLAHDPRAIKWLKRQC